MLFGLDMSGLGEDKPPKKKKEEEPPKPVLPPAPPAKSPALLPRWTPLAIGGVGFGVIVLILLTSKGKD